MAGLLLSLSILPVEAKIKPKALAKTSQIAATLALDPAGQPHCAYQSADYHLFHAKFDGQRWQHELVDATSDCGWDNSIAVDKSGHLHIAYHAERMNPYRQPVCYAYFNGAQWQITELPGNGWQPQLCLDADNRPHIVFSDASYGLHYAHREDTGWEIEPIGFGGGPYPPRFALAPDGVVHLAYAVNSGGIFHLSNETGSWQTTRLADVAGSCAIAVDRAGNPRIATTESGNLTDHQRDGTNWTSHVLFDASTYPDALPDYVALALDSNDRPHFLAGIYIRAGEGGVETCWYAFDDGRGWSGGPLDAKNAGFYPSLVVDANGIVTGTYCSGLKNNSATTKYVRILRPDLGGEWATPSFGNGALTGILNVANHGLDKSATARIGFAVSEDPQFDMGDTILPNTLKLKGLKPGASVALSVNLPSLGAYAGKYLLAVIDADLVTLDANLTDNIVPVLLAPEMLQ
jgi:hypothetical protein